MIIWWSKYVGVILSVLVCDILINVLLQTSALVGPLYTVYNLLLSFLTHKTEIDSSVLYMHYLHILTRTYICVSMFVSSPISGAPWR
jgi:hypothetical protein